jgi:hypothetical protein
VLAAAVTIAGCKATEHPVAAAWRGDCPSRQEPPPLSLEAAREVRRLAERRSELRLREAAEPGSVLRALDAALDPASLAAGTVCLADVADLGQLVFEHEYGFADGLGGGTAGRGPAGPFRRVHGGLFGGPEAIGCTSCHWLGGPNGAGSETDNAFLQGDGERPDSGDARNPPALVAPGVVEALAREMTRDLQGLRNQLVRAGKEGEVALVTKGVDFGVLKLTANGDVDASGVSGVDPDLVVKPFGWKGTLATFADFSNEALQVHMGVQSAGLVAKAAADVVGHGDDRDDPDGDGMRDELDRGPFAAMTVHLALQPLPIVEPMIQDRPLKPSASGLLAPTTTSFAEEFQRGRRLFHEVGCAGCHQPMMVLESPILALDGLPPLDLSKDMRHPALAWDPDLGGYPVWLFSDLKRHDMGPQNAARHVQNGVATAAYLTPRLWGAADSAPYLHDGRAPSFDYAIAGHDGEGAAARDAFAALSMHEQGALRVYLMSLRRAPRLIVP